MALWDCKGVELAPGESVPMVGVVENQKRMLRRLISLLWVVTYLARIFGRCWQNPPGAGDEIQLTDAIDMLIEKKRLKPII